MDAAANVDRRRRHAQAAGLATWALVGVPIAITIAREPAFAGRAEVVGWLAAYAVFGVAYWFSSWGWKPRWPVGAMRALVLVQSVAATAANWLIPLPMPQMPIGGVLLVIAAARLAEAFTPRWALVLVLAQTGAMLAAFRWPWAWPWGPAIATSAAFGTFQLFACMVGLLAKSEERARRELASSLASLRATQAMLAQSAAIAERARIDRELHDVLGHHLVVLSLNLQTAAGMCEGRAAELVRGAHGLTRLILSDLRSMVREHGELQGVDLKGAVERLAAAVPGVAVESSVGADVEPLEPAVAHAVFRCVQECLTNTLKHAGASRAGVSVARENGSVRVEAWDNGRGGSELAGTGTGLCGMRDRVEALGGTLEVRSAPGQGFRIIALVPSGAKRGAA